MKLLVTGGLGFIGSNFIRYMLSHRTEIEIVNVDNLSPLSNPMNLADIKGDGRYKFLKGDLTDRNFANKVARDADLIVNFAAESHVDRSISDPRPFLMSNTVGAFNLLDASRRSPKDQTFVQVGTDEVYGDIPNGSAKETDRLLPSSPYSASKAAADMLVHAFHRTYGMKVMITRCTNNFGPYQALEKFIPKTVVRLILKLKVPVYGTGQQVRDWIYVEDHCKAIELVAKKGRAGEVYNIAGGSEMQNIELVAMILKLLNRPSSFIEKVADRPGHDKRYSINSSKVRNELGWRPIHTFQEALSKTVTWYVENEKWWRQQVSRRILSPTPWK